MKIPESPDYLASLQSGWEALGHGAPTLVALAQLCAKALLDQSTCDDDDLSQEARTILYAARERGTIEVRGVNTAFEATARMLAIYVEENEQKTIAFRNREDPKATVRFFEGFCQLCRYGYVIHHLYRDFSLTHKGFQLAVEITREEVEAGLSQATEFGLHD